MSNLTIGEMYSHQVFKRPIVQVIEEFTSNNLKLHPAFSSDRSKKALATVHPDMVKICNRVIDNFDFSALEGARSTATQQAYFAEGRSTLDGINKLSKHQLKEGQVYSMALDIAPYPIDFSEHLKAKARFYMLAGRMLQAAEDLLYEGEITHKLRFGGDWDMDSSFEDQSFDDLPHFELISSLS